MGENLKNPGFTIIEFVVVILITGILSAIVLPNLRLDNFRDRGGFQQGMAAIRFAQKLAISSGCQVDVSIGASSCTLAFNGCTGSSLVNPGTGDTNFCSSSNPGVSPAVNVSFNSIGAPLGGQQTLVFAGGQTVTIEANTGFAHE